MEEAIHEVVEKGGRERKNLPTLRFISENGRTVLRTESASIASLPELVSPSAAVLRAYKG